jgi:hypothetical protein
MVSPKNGSAAQCPLKPGGQLQQQTEQREGHGLRGVKWHVQVPPDRWQRDGDHRGVDPCCDDPKIIAATTHRPCAER